MYRTIDDVRRACIRLGGKVERGSAVEKELSAIQAKADSAEGPGQLDQLATALEALETRLQ